MFCFIRLGFNLPILILFRAVGSGVVVLANGGSFIFFWEIFVPPVGNGGRIPKGYLSHELPLVERFCYWENFFDT